jgi:hypothetical protein
MVQHEWHLISDYCIHCGMSRVHELDPPYQCHRHKNVTAISHIVRNKNVLRTSIKDNNYSPNDDSIW